MLLATAMNQSTIYTINIDMRNEEVRLSKPLTVEDEQPASQNA